MTPLICLALPALLAAPLGADLNRVRTPGPYPVTPRARALLDAAPAIDLHADTLLWMRDVTAPAKIGHADLPRLLAGGVGLQVFSVVTRVPEPLRMAGNRGGDGLRRLYQAAGRADLIKADGLARALERAAALRASAEASPALDLVRRKRDLDAGAPGKVLAILALEGLHAPATPDVIDRLFDAGYRMIGPVHFLDTPMGGSAHGIAVKSRGGGGLTPDGERALARMYARGMVVDLAHSARGQEELRYAAEARNLDGDGP